MSLERLLASDQIRPRLETVLDTVPVATSSVVGGNGSTQLDIKPTIRVRNNVEIDAALKQIVDVLIDQSGGDVAPPVSGSINFENGGLYFVGAGSSRADDISYRNDRSDPEAPSLYIDAREGNDTIDIDGGRRLPSDGERASAFVSVFAGEGDDQARVFASNIRNLDGGDGSDTLFAQGGSIGLVEGGAGGDRISAVARTVGAVYGGEGDDLITAFGDTIGVVDGGDGNDAILVSTRNLTDNPLAPEFAAVFGGTGDDRIGIDGRAQVYFGAGDGKDSFALTDTAVFRLQGGLSLDNAEIVQDGNRLVITFGETGDQISIRGLSEQLHLEVTSPDTFAIVPFNGEYDPASLVLPAEPVIEELPEVAPEDVIAEQDLGETDATAPADETAPDEFSDFEPGSEPPPPPF
ncbi:MAG: hypothetical protein WC807_19360 [Hyphomicrobium sp.]|jgi:hypothetical protein